MYTGVANLESPAVGSGVQHRGTSDRGRCPIPRRTHPARPSLGFPRHGVVVSEIGQLVPGSFLTHFGYISVRFQSFVALLC